jgi:hypothetical protein
MRLEGGHAGKVAIAIAALLLPGAGIALLLYAILTRTVKILHWRRMSHSAGLSGRQPI